MILRRRHGGTAWVRTDRFPEGPVDPKLDGVDGESVDIKYAKWMSDLSITKFLDTSSPKLFEKCCEGAHIGGATLVMRKAGEKPLEFCKIRLGDVLSCRQVRIWELAEAVIAGPCRARRAASGRRRPTAGPARRSACRG